MHKLKKSLIAIAAAAAVGTSGFFGWRYYADSHVTPIKVYPFSYVGMTEYWGDSRESYGPVTTDRIQTVYLSDTQTVSEILVKKDQQVKKGDLLMRFDTTLSQLEVERKELAIQKNQMDLEEAQKELQRISWMVPMGTPPTEPETEPPQPTAPAYKVFAQGDYEAYKTTLSATINDVIYQTKDAYFNLLFAFENRRVAEDTVKKFEMFYNQAKAFE